MVLKDREQLITDLAMARLENTSREDLERIYVETMAEQMDQLGAVDLVRYAESYGVDYQLEESGDEP